MAEAKAGFEGLISTEASESDGTRTISENEKHGSKRQNGIERRRSQTA